MRYILSALFLCVLSIATHADGPRPDDRACKDGLGFSLGVAALCLPLEFYRGAVIAPAGGLLVKFVDGSYFSVQAITTEQEGLPATFDMRVYPEYLMGSGSSDKLPAKELEKFKNSKMVLLERYGKQGIRVEKFKGYTALVAGNAQAGEIFLTFDQRSDALLLLVYSAISEDKLRSIKEGFK